MNQEYYPQWRDENAERLYPFEDTASLVSSNGLLKLQDRWLVDAAIYPVTGVAPYSVLSVRIDNNTCFVTLGDSEGTVIGVGATKRTDTRPLAIKDGSTFVASLVVGEDANHSLFEAGDGDYLFDQGAATFVNSCVMPLTQILGFSGFTVGNETLNGGSIAIVGEHGVQITTSLELEQQTGQRQAEVVRVRIHAMGDPQYLTRNCEDISRRPLRFIREVVFQYNDYTHSCKPNELGNVTMLAGSASASDPALQIRPTGEAVIIRLSGKSI